MAYRRSLTTSARLVARQRFAPSISCTHHEDDRKNCHSDEKVKSFFQSRSYSNTTNTWLGFGGMSFQDPKRSHVPMTTSGFLLARNMSTMNGDKTMEFVSSTQTAAVSEVAAAAAAADSWPPVAALQYAIDGIHIYTGLNWGASLIITTLVIRTLLVPFQISQLKVALKSMKMTSELKQLKHEMQLRGLSPIVVAEGQERMKRFYNREGIGHFTPYKSLFIQGIVFGSFFLAIQKMVEKVPSLQTGGISWFIDLTTPDSLYILPFLAAFSFWATLESNRHGGTPTGVTMKILLWGLSAVTVPLAASFPNALLCCWITSNCFSIVYGRIIKKPSVKKLLNIPTVKPCSLDLLEKYSAGKAMQQRPTITNQNLFRHHFSVTRKRQRTQV